MMTATKTHLLAAAAASFVLAGASSARAGAPAQGFTVDTSGSSASVSAASPGTVSVVIQPQHGLKVHPEAPLTVTLAAGGPIAIAKDKLTRGDVVDAAAAAPELKTEVRATGTGAGQIAGEVSFFLCSEKKCKRMKQKFKIAVDAKGG